MLLYSLLLSSVLYFAHSAEPCGDIRSKKGCRKTDHCQWKNKSKKCLTRPGFESPTESPTSLMPTTNPTMKPSPKPSMKPTSLPTRLETSSPTQMPTRLETSSPTQMPTHVETSSPTQMPTRPQTPSPTEEPTSTPIQTSMPTAVSNNLCAAYDSTGCSPFVDGNVADDVFEALMGCSNGPNCNANNSGKVDRSSYKYCNHHNEMTDAEVIAEEMAIRTALLNNMSSSCEKWCLFDAYKPFGRSWMWDNNSKCWKKQGNRGKCQKNMNSVRRSEEIKTVLDRAFGICEVPTDAPRAESILTRKRESCTEACIRVFGDELTCSAEGIESTHNGRSNYDISKMFAKAGVEKCKIFAEGKSDHADPSYDSHTGECVTRHPGAIGNPCEKKPEGNYRRLCVCASWKVIENRSS